MESRQPSFLPLALKTIVVHTVTYFIMGLLASTILDYGAWYAGETLRSFMRQTSDPMVMAGPLLQPIRGLLFAVVFYLLRDAFFGRKYGWLVMWVTLVIVGILSPFGPSPGSIEGMIYTILPLPMHLKGWPEVILQALFFSLLLTYWVNHPGVKWLTWLLIAVFVVIMVLPALGLLVGQAP